MQDHCRSVHCHGFQTSLFIVTGLDTNFACYWIRIMPEIVSKATALLLKASRLLPGATAAYLGVGNTLCLCLPVWSAKPVPERCPRVLSLNWLSKYLITPWNRLWEWLPDDSRGLNLNSNLNWNYFKAQAPEFRPQSRLYYQSARELSAQMLQSSSVSLATLLPWEYMKVSHWYMSLCLPACTRYWGQH